MSLFKSVYSDPVNSGVRAFSEMTQALNAIEDAPIKRQLMEEEVRDRAQQRELRKTQEERQKKENAWIDQSRLDEKQLRILHGAQIKANEGIDLSDEEIDIISKAAPNSITFGGVKNAGELKDRVRDVDKFTTGIKDLEPIIQGKLKEAKEKGLPVARITRDEAPELANLFDRVYGEQINQGTGRDGKKAEKRLHSIMIQPDGTMAIELEVTDDKGSYYAPLTPGRSGDPNEPVQTMPMSLFVAHAGAQDKFGKTITAAMVQKGDKEVWKKIEAEQTDAKEGKAAKKANEAVDALPADATTEKKRRTFMASAMENGMTAKRATEMAKEIIPEKQARALTKSDLALAAAGGDPEEALKKMDTSKGTNKTIYGPGGATKEVNIKQGEDYTPPKGWSLKAPRDIDYESRELTHELIRTRIDDLKDKNEKKKLAPFIKDQKKNIDTWATEKKKSPPAGALPDEIEGIKTDIDETKDRAKELVDEGMNSGEALKQAQKEKNTSTNAIERRSTIDRAGRKIKKEMTGPEGTFSKNWTSQEVVNQYRKKGWPDRDILEAGDKAGVDLRGVLQETSPTKKTLTPPEELNKKTSVGATAKKETIETTKKVMSSMPPAENHKGKTIKDTETGKRYKSDGKKWVEI